MVPPAGDPPEARAMNVAQALLHGLRDYGAGEVFGVPGDFALPFFKVMEESRILPLHTLSHEPAVGFAADAAGRFRGTIGVAAVTYGAGAFNLVNAVCGAFAEKLPVVVISGAPGAAESRSGLLLHHQGRTLETQFRVYQEVTCAQTRLADPATAPGEIARVLSAAIDQARPVYIELPRDMVGIACGPVPAYAPAPPDPDAVAACADEIMERLRKARRPVIMVDVEVRRYGLETKVAALTRKLGIPVVTSFMGRGLLSTTGAPLAGTYLGVAGDPAVTGLVEGSDGLLLLGVILSDTNFGVNAGQLDLRRTVQALDRQVGMGFHQYRDIPLAALVEALLARATPLGRAAAAPGPAHPRGLVADDAPIAPDDIARAVNDLFDRHGLMPIAADIGDCLFTAMEIAHTELTAPGYYAGMGYGVPAGIGAQLATGRRALILVGDGAFQMTGWELGNCRRLGIDPIVILFNNTSWEMLRVFQPESTFNDLDDWHFADIAASIGGDGRRVATRAELARALQHAVATRGRFQLIEAMLPRGAMSATLSRFVVGLRRLHAAKDAA
jgi:indolepyruvate decarboxylase